MTPLLLNEIKKIKHEQETKRGTGKCSIEGAIF